MTGIELIAQERKEQIEKHGFDVSNDDYKNGELLQAAQFALGEESWPYDWQEVFAKKIIMKSPIGQLKVAAAFLAAEIDRQLAKNPNAQTN